MTGPNQVILNRDKGWFMSIRSIALAICLGYFCQISLAVDGVTDGANLARYHDDSQALASQTKVPGRVVFMGDSITEGWGISHPQFIDNKTHINRGISGQTTPQILLRFKQDVLDLNPDVVVILAGANDIAGNTGPATLKTITDNISCMIQLAKVRRIKVTIGTVLPTDHYSWAPTILPVPQINKLSKWLLHYSGQQHFNYIDWYNSLKTPKGALDAHYGDNGVEPNSREYIVLENLLTPVLQRTLTELFHP
jgi:lysophospholipase L1-like esterase